MALLDRVKLRIETDLTDAELQSMIDEIVAEIDARFGVVGAITVFLDGDRALDGDRKFLALNRPDSGATITITEIDGTDETLLVADDFRILHGGRTLERLIDGTNGRDFWERLVKVVYTPVSDQKERDEVVIQMVQLGIEHRGLKSEKDGDYSAGFADYPAEREKIIGRLTPMRGVMMA